MHKIEYPPAFPFQPLNLQGEPSFPEYGMTLRDWFAGQALTGMIAAGANFHEHKETAKNAFDFADAMLAARQGGDS